MDLISFAAVTASVVLGSIVQVLTGVGGGFIVIPLLAIIDLSLVPAPVIFASLALSGVMAVRERAAIDWVHLPLILTGMLPGAVLGAYLITRLPLDKLGIVFGVVILIAIVITAVGKPLPPKPSSSLAAGAVAGVMGASSGIGAPLVALLYQHETGARLRSTLAILYVTASVLILLVLAGFNRFSGKEMVAGLYLMPGYLLGYLLARRFTITIDKGKTRLAVLAVSAAAAIALVIRSLPDEFWP
jgi:uncharacterized membrane protein YfcA